MRASKNLNDIKGKTLVTDVIKIQLRFSKTIKLNGCAIIGFNCSQSFTSLKIKSSRKKSISGSLGTLMPASPNNIFTEKGVQNATNKNALLLLKVNSVNTANKAGTIAMV